MNLAQVVAQFLQEKFAMRSGQKLTIDTGKQSVPFLPTCHSIGNSTQRGRRRISKADASILRLCRIVDAHYDTQELIENKNLQGILMSFMRGVGVVLIMLLCCPSRAQATSPYVLTDLGSLGGNLGSEAYAINAKGQVVGRSTAAGKFSAFLWTPTTTNGTTGSMISIPVGEWAHGINEHGQIIGWGFDVCCGPNRSGFLWTPTTQNGTSGVVTNLGDFPERHPDTQAWGINSQGQVTGFSSGTNAQQAFIWTPTTSNGTSGSMVGLSGLPNNIHETTGIGINSYGQIVGQSFNTARFGENRATLWTPTTRNGTTGSMVSLGDLPGGWEESFAYGINDRGQVVGSGFSDSGMRAFLWTPTVPNGTVGTMAELGELSGAPYSQATAINLHGQIVGYTSGESNYRPFLWTPVTPNATTGTIVDLNTLIDPAVAIHWELLAAEGINDFGQIVGFGLFDPDGSGDVPNIPRAFLLTPIPEPSSGLIVLAVTITGTFARYRSLYARHQDILTPHD